ncbi:MAG: hypothetical protein HY595_00610 [Candidatus Omnitrophica bacterium]|nr:hypothetical protein [Candidatus Omnitrophota bacterium]
MPPADVRWWIVAPECLPGGLPLPADAPLEWCYCGTDEATRARTAAALRLAREIPIEEPLTQLAHEMKQPYLDWLVAIGRRQPDHVSWWASTFATSSPLQTDVFLLICYTRLIDAWLCSTPPATVRCIVVEDPWLALTLRWQFGRDLRVAWRGVGLAACARDALKWLSRVPRAVLATVRSAMTSYGLVRLWFPRTWESLEGRRRDTTLLYTWIRPECFQQPGRLSDAWTGRLDAMLTAAGERVTRLTPAEIPPPLLRRLRQHAVPCLVTPRYLGWLDVVRTLCAWFRVHHLGALAQCQGWDYRWLVRRETLREWGRVDFWHYRIGYFAMRRLAGRVGASVRCVIYPFEDQPWEKLLCLAWRERAPHVKLVGYQHSWVPPLLLPYTLGRGAEEITPLPDQIVASSVFNLEQLKIGGYPLARLVNGGALRHEYLHTKLEELIQQRVARYGRNRATAPRTVLVTFPISRPHASRLLADLSEAFRQPLMSESKAGGSVRFLLKFHPALPLTHLVPYGFALPSWMKMTELSMPRLLPDVDLLLYVGPTSSWWEAFLCGVPVLKYRADLVDIDAGQEPEAMPVPVCNGASLRASVEATLKAGTPVRPVAAALVERMYGSVDEEVWTSLIRTCPEEAADAAT